MEAPENEGEAVTSINNQMPQKADLVGGKVPSSQLPSLAITEYLGAVASQAAMLLLTGEPGDFCFRSDQGVAYFITSGDGSLLAHWQAVSTPASVGVVSVNGHVGVVVLAASDVGAVPTSRTVTGTKSLTSGGNLAANRSLELVNDEATPAAHRHYGTDEDGVKGWRPSVQSRSESIYGHTEPGGDASPPPPLDIEFYDQPEFTFSITTEEGTQDFTGSQGDPENGSTWINTDGTSSVAGSIAQAVETALSSAYLPDLQISREDNHVFVGRSYPGESISIECHAFDGCSVTGGGIGQEGGAPSGGQLDVTIMEGPHSILSGWWSSEVGFEASIELYDPNDDFVIWSTGPVGGFSGGPVTITGWEQVQRALAPGALALRSTNTELEGGNFALTLFLL